MLSGKLLVFAVPLLLAIGCAGGDLSPSPVSTPSPEGEALTPETTPTVTAIPTVAATSTVTASPTVTAEAGGLDGFRAYAVQIAEAVAEGDTAFFADRALEDEVVCAGDEEIGPCYGQPKGTVLQGIPGAVAESDAFTLYSLTEYPEVLGDWFSSASPDGAPILHAIAHRPSSQGEKGAYQAIVTGIIVVGQTGSTVLRQQGRIFDFRFVDGSWRLTGELYASLPETIKPWRYGECSDCYDHWERWPEATR